VGFTGGLLKLTLPFLRLQVPFLARGIVIHGSLMTNEIKQKADFMIE
jgi:hypothetical protein